MAPLGWLDSSGNLYIADSFNTRVRKVAKDGTITTVAGGPVGGPLGDGGPATSAQLQDDSGITVDSQGNLYIADSADNRIRKVSPAGIITTVAGNGSAGYSGDGGPATSAELNVPWAVAVDSAGNLHIADTYNSCIRKVDTSGVITTLAGTGTRGYSGDGGTATAAELSITEDVVVDSAGDVYIADTGNERIRVVTLDGIIRTIGGNGENGYSGDGGPAVSASFYMPTAVALDPAGDVYIADEFNHAVRLLTKAGGPALLTVVSTHTGSRFDGPAHRHSIQRGAGRHCQRYCKRYRNRAGRLEPILHVRGRLELHCQYL